jgi:hypothetical protein
MTKKEFKSRCYFNSYGSGKSKINAIWFDWNDTMPNIGYKYMVKATIDNCKRKELFDCFYDWVINEKPLRYYYINYKYAINNEDRFKVPLSMSY